jgi:hypothetical protein
MPSRIKPTMCSIAAAHAFASEAPYGLSTAAGPAMPNDDHCLPAFHLFEDAQKILMGLPDCHKRIGRSM